MRRIAVLGVPRGGTTLVTGLLRILGYQLPAQDPCCLLGESRVIRWADSPLDGNLDALTAAVADVPDGVVWKDPAVALYADRIDWTGWDLVRVVRDPDEVAASEARWLTEPVDLAAMTARASQWDARLDEVQQVGALLASDTVRRDPLWALSVLAGRFCDMTPTGGHRALATAFIRGGGGYFCPFPGGCELDGEAHRL